MQPNEKEGRPPHPLDSLRELGAGLDLLRGLASAAKARLSPGRDVGHGARVAVLPGYGMDDATTLLLRRCLDHHGFKAEGWGLGRNTGAVPDLARRFAERLSHRVAAFATPYALVGWSLGGYIAREVARSRPDLVARVVTLGSPVKGGPKHTVLAPLFKARGFDFERAEERMAAREEVPLQVPVTAIYSRRDGIVGWRACLSPEEKMVTHVEVTTSHSGMGFAPEVLDLVVRSLAGGTETP
ncbi:alpha/beta fold hydrolase [Zavarzinia sp.]|uniref:alpha/beta fold hydrolase n=1 Tax=Zavarzinia sp. TaxID=2027920 RepID=UPI003564ECB6